MFSFELKLKPALCVCAAATAWLWFCHKTFSASTKYLAVQFTFKPLEAYGCVFVWFQGVSSQNFGVSSGQRGGFWG